MVTAVRSRATVTTGRLGGVIVDLMLDLGSSVSLVQRNIQLQAQDVMRSKVGKPLQLVMASGEQLFIFAGALIPGSHPVHAFHEANFKVSQKLFLVC